MKRAARNKAVSLWRQNHKLAESVSFDEAKCMQSRYVNEAMEKLNNQERAAQLNQAIERLPEKYRHVVVACSINGIAVTEYAITVGIHPECAASRLRRALARLARDSILRDWFYCSLQS